MYAECQCEFIDCRHAAFGRENEGEYRYCHGAAVRSFAESSGDGKKCFTTFLCDECSEQWIEWFRLGCSVDIGMGAATEFVIGPKLVPGLWSKVVIYEW